MTETVTNAAGSPWVYLFSRFTSEALLFESLIIFTLIAVYTGFWLLRKRKFGVVEHQVPASVVKYYLNELIVDAEQLRAQLFGLLSGQGITPTPLANLNLGSGIAAAATAATAGLATAGAGAGATVAGDPQNMTALEAKIAAQAKQIEAFIADKMRIEQELAAARAAKGGALAGGAAGTDAKLQEKIAQLEGKLAEYSVIEDDLANLKRLQQENAALRAQLAAKGITPATGAATGATTGPTTATATEAPATDAGVAAAAAQAPTAPAAVQETATAPTASAAPTPAAAAAAAPQAPAATAAQTAPAPTATPTVAAAPAAATAGTAAAAPTPGAPGLSAAVAQAETGAMGEAGFEGFVNQVEQSLQPQAQPDAAGDGATAPSTTPVAPATIEKSDADLVAEFEKMLNG